MITNLETKMTTRLLTIQPNIFIETRDNRIYLQVSSLHSVVQGDSSNGDISSRRDFFEPDQAFFLSDISLDLIV